jgi:hypothetical protein
VPSNPASLRIATRVSAINCSSSTTSTLRKIISLRLAG